MRLEMARITVEDCLENVDNRFQLVLVSSKRARQIMQGAEPFVDRENDKPTVIALREIAEGYVSNAILHEEAQQALMEADEITDEDRDSEDAVAEAGPEEKGPEAEAAGDEPTA